MNRQVTEGQILIEWSDSPQMRKARAVWQRKRLWHLCKWAMPLSAVLWGGLILLILAAAPWAVQAIVWWKLYLAGCAGVVILLAGTTLMASVPDSANHYAMTESGIFVNSRLHRWTGIAGYCKDMEADSDGVTTIDLVLANHRRWLLRIPPGVPLERVSAIMAVHLSVLRREDMDDHSRVKLTGPLPVTFTLIWSLVGGLLVAGGTNPALLMAVTFCFGPGALWVLSCHWRRVRRAPMTLLDGLPLNIIACYAMMFVATLLFLHRINPT